MKCYQCGNNAMFMVGAEKDKIPLCLSCHLKFVQLLDKQNEMLEREINYLTASMESSAGLPSFLPRYPERKIIKTGEVTLNNIKINNSTLGVLNTGSIESIDLAITSLNKSGDMEISNALKKLSEEIIKQTEVEEGIKNQLFELLSVISIEATAPKEKKRKSVLKPLIIEFSTIIGGIPGLVKIWEEVQPIVEKILN